MAADLNHRIEVLARRAAEERQARELARAIESSLIKLRTALQPLYFLGDAEDDPRPWEEVYADLVVKAARAVRDYTGWKTARALTPPDKPELEIAHELFRRAFDGAEVEALVGEVRSIVDRIVKAGSREGLVALRDYYGWLFDHLGNEVEPRLPPTRRALQSRQLPDPTPEALRSARSALRCMKPGDRLTVKDVMRLYGMLEADPRSFTKSSRFVQGAGKKHHPWQVPYVAGRTAPMRGAGRRFEENRWWTPAEVARAVEGLARRLGVELKAPASF